MKTMTYEEAQRQIAEAIHAYDHPEYDTCTYCAMCWATAGNWLGDLPPKDDDVFPEPPTVAEYETEFGSGAWHTYQETRVDIGRDYYSGGGVTQWP
jgi:hypothetical protein